MRRNIVIHQQQQKPPFFVVVEYRMIRIDVVKLCGELRGNHPWANGPDVPSAGGVLSVHFGRNGRLAVRYGSSERGRTTVTRPTVYLSALRSRFRRFTVTTASAVARWTDHQDGGSAQDICDSADARSCVTDARDDVLRIDWVGRTIGARDTTVTAFWTSCVRRTA